jgi:hypothetical protein
MINIESGKIIACDPIVMGAARPFSQKFPVGIFPVQLSIAAFNGDERVTLSFYGYGVDAGIGMFIDADANIAFSSLRKTDQDLWDRVFRKEINNHNHHTWQNVVYNFQMHSLACFSTGLGDGHHGSYVGYDSKGEVCRLLTDFGIISWWKVPERS